MAETMLTVGQAARHSGLTPKAIRLYESKGLLPPAERTEAGYRLFTRGDLAVLTFIRQAKVIGLKLDEIGEILQLQRGGHQPCGRVIDLLDAHLADIDRTLSDLRALRRTLAAARTGADAHRRQGGAAVVCRIIETASS